MTFEKLLQTVEQKQKHSIRTLSFHATLSTIFGRLLSHEKSVRKKVEVIRVRDGCVWFASKRLGITPINRLFKLEFPWNIQSVIVKKKT